MKTIGKYTYFYRDKIAQWNLTSFIDNKGITYNCAEQYMMAKKALLFDDIDSYHKIMKTKSPQEQQEFGRLVKNFNKGIWDIYSMTIVYQANIYKFEQNKDLLDILLSTKNTILVEVSPIDFIWGIGLGIDNPDILDIEKWIGLNQLGYILTSLRDNYFLGKKS